ncbi:hypothetical protein DFJ58DRAFT_732671 [Suillus subalutaceus]|uniref:uncharacterized protein n=1 Tax=Suillus subalutaceus TaxID=48586 RepID=UPI001B876966|nr:uncharacterized protein DFJ58DRAFT_732671 [Suillus subalutaceus]KAG1840921.1 hypothetical protein DFJ58DRAFT_732671 [Suillus subalutaceus]
MDIFIVVRDVDIHLTVEKTRSIIIPTVGLVPGGTSSKSSRRVSLPSSDNSHVILFQDDDHRHLCGLGGSTHPTDVQSSSTLADIAGDLTCVPEHVGIEPAICLGHDWGAEVMFRGYPETT